MNTQTNNKCTFCSGENCIITNYTLGEVVCTNCGIIHEERIIDEEYEGRNFVDENGINDSRVGRAINYSYDDQLSLRTVLVNKTDNYLSVRRQKVSPIQKLFKRAEELCDTLGIPKMIFECSKDLLHILLRANLIKKNYIDHIISIVFYKELYSRNIQRSLADIRHKLGLTKHDMKKAYALIEGYLSDDPNPLEQLKANLNLFCLKLKIDPPEKEKIEQIGENIVKNRILTGTTSGTIAAAVILLYGKLLKKNDITLSTLKSITSIKADQIKSAYLVITQHTQLIPNELKDYLDNLNVQDVI